MHGNNDKHPLDAVEEKALDTAVLLLAKNLKDWGVDRNAVSSDAAWALFIQRTQIVLIRQGVEYLFTRTLEVYRDPQHSFRDEFERRWLALGKAEERCVICTFVL